jgi:hypothetical protein
LWARQQLKVHATHVTAEDRRLTPKTCRGLRDNKVFVTVKVKVY